MTDKQRIILALCYLLDEIDLQWDQGQDDGDMRGELILNGVEKVTVTYQEIQDLIERLETDKVTVAKVISP
jgi:hypothetical protein